MATRGGGEPLKYGKQKEFYGEPGGIRTRDPRLKRALLYQLSYRPTDLTVSGRTTWPPQFIKTPTVKFCRQSSDLSSVSAYHQLPEKSIRSKGQATLLPAGYPELSAAIRDISATGIGVIAANLVDPGTLVEIHIHGYTASGVVRNCQPQGDGFYIAIALAA